jgi:hypothetical protein
VSIIAWPSTRSNVIVQFATNEWTHYRSAYRVSETIKYIVSRIGDRSCLNELTGLGATPLYMAAQGGNAILVEILLKAGCDPNLGVSRTPLNGAKEFLEKCQKQVKKALASTEPGEKKRTLKLLKNAEATIRLLQEWGGYDRSGYAMTYEAMQNGYTLGSMARPEVKAIGE